MPFQEVVEAEGHLIDSHIMEQIFDTVVEYNGRFEVEEFRIGRTNGEPSYLRLHVETPDDADDGAAAQPAARPGLHAGRFRRRRAARRSSATAARPKISTPPPTTARWSAIGQQWVEVENQRMDAMIVVAGGRASCRRLRDLRAGDQVVVGMRGIRVVPESKERDRLAFAFMSNGISSERQVETAVRQTAALMRQTRRAEAEDRRGRRTRGGPHRRRRRPCRS